MSNTCRPMLELDGRPDGAVSSDGKVMGCYLHGLFAADPFRRSFLHRIHAGAISTEAYETLVEQTLDALADHLEQHIKIDRLLAVAGLH